MPLNTKNMVFAQIIEPALMGEVCGDVVAKWIAQGTLNTQVTGSKLNTASWLTM